MTILDGTVLCKSWSTLWHPPWGLWKTIENRLRLEYHEDNSSDKIFDIWYQKQQLKQGFVVKVCYRKPVGSQTYIAMKLVFKEGASLDY